MNVWTRISDGLNSVASGTSRRRVKAEEKVRLEHHGGPAHELYERALPFADEVERLASQIDSDI